MLRGRLYPSRYYCFDRYSKKTFSTIFIAGVGRSGTTWISEVLNSDRAYRDIFEPFHPYRHRDSSSFNYHQYIGDAGATTLQSLQATRILRGRTQGLWINKYNHRLVARARIIKDIRANLMLHWLKRLEPAMPVVLLMRNPLDVYRSWQRLGWGMQDRGEHSDFDALCGQSNLMEEFPKLADLSRQIGTDAFSRFVFVWCALYLVPLSKLSADEYLLCHYESFNADPVSEFGRLYSFLGLSISGSEIIDRVAQPSATSVPGSAYGSTEISVTQLESAQKMLSYLELDKFYCVFGDESVGW